MVKMQFEGESWYIQLERYQSTGKYIVRLSVVMLDPKLEGSWGSVRRIHSRDAI